MNLRNAEFFKPPEESIVHATVKALDDNLCAGTWGKGQLGFLRSLGKLVPREERPVRRMRWIDITKHKNGIVLVLQILNDARNVFRGLVDEALLNVNDDKTG